MSKILLVEDDNNLREIYEARLRAEGYEIVSARDGEEALTVAMKERPDLIISDVMMPKISGFDMLDIIRSTEETKNVKVIMMTALSQAEDKARAEKLGADRYLVKSQVTLEDVAKVARQVLNDESYSESEAKPVSSPVPQPPAAVNPPVSDGSTPTPAVTSVPADQPSAPVTVDAPVVDNSAASTNPALAAIAVDDSSVVTSTDAPTPPEVEKTTVEDQIESFVGTNKASTSAEPAVNTAETPPVSQTPEQKDDASDATHTGKKIIQPISDPNASKEQDLNLLLEKEKEKEAMEEIARNLVAEKSDGINEQEAEETLRNASPKTESQEPVAITSNELKITEDGDLEVKEAPPSSAPAVDSPALDTTTLPAVPQTQAPELSTNTPNGTNIDGVVPTTPTTDTNKPASTGLDPDSIAL